MLMNYQVDQCRSFHEGKAGTLRTGLKLDTDPKGSLGGKQIVWNGDRDLKEAGP